MTGNIFYEVEIFGEISDLEADSKEAAVEWAEIQFKEMCIAEGVLSHETEIKIHKFSCDDDKIIELDCDDLIIGYEHQSSDFEEHNTYWGR